MLINGSALLTSVETKDISPIQTPRTLAGGIHVCEMFTIRDLRLPKFDHDQQIERLKAFVCGCLVDMTVS